MVEQKKLSELRESIGISREKLAALAGCTGQTVWRAENDANITVKTYNKIYSTLIKLKENGNNNNIASDFVPITPSVSVEVIQ